MSDTSSGGTPPTFDPRSESILATLLPAVRPYFRALLAAVRGAGIDAKWISGTRTYAEQNALYAQGRTADGPVVTNARGGYSLHNFGIAADIGIWERGAYLDDSDLYDRAGRIGAALGLEWGGNWHSLVDKPHFQIRTGKSLAQMREDVAAGRSVLDGVTLPPPPANTGGGAPSPADSPAAGTSPWAAVLPDGTRLTGLLLPPTDPGRNYAPAAALLRHFWNSGTVYAYLTWNSAARELSWQGTPIPAPVWQDSNGTVWVQIAAACAWLGLTATPDPLARTIVITRPVAP